MFKSGAHVVRSAEIPQIIRLSGTPPVPAALYGRFPNVLSNGIEFESPAKHIHIAPEIAHIQSYETLAE